MLDTEAGKRTWSHEEDQLLLDAIQRQGGPKNWGLIAEEHGTGLAALGLQPRSAKSCRLRWFNQLSPDINRTPLTKKEEDLIDALVNSLGTCWSAIAKHLPGRTDNIVKNYWYGKFGNRTRCRKRKSQGAEYTQDMAMVQELAVARPARRERRGSMRRATTADDGYSTLSDTEPSDEEACTSGMSSGCGALDGSDGAEAASPSRRRVPARRASTARRASVGTRAGSGNTGVVASPAMWMGPQQEEQDSMAAAHNAVAAVPAECAVAMPVIATLKRLNTGTASRTGSQASAGAVADDGTAALAAVTSGACSPSSASAGRSRMARGSSSMGLGSTRAAPGRQVSFASRGDLAAAAAAAVGAPSSRRASVGAVSYAPTFGSGQPQPTIQRSDLGQRLAMTSSAAQQLQAGISQMQVQQAGPANTIPAGLQGPAAAALALMQGACMPFGATAAPPFSSMTSWPGSCCSLGSRMSVGSYCQPASAAQTPRYDTAPAAPMSALSLQSFEDSMICNDYKSLSLMLSDGAAPALGWAAASSSLDPCFACDAVPAAHAPDPALRSAADTAPATGLADGLYRRGSALSSASAWDPLGALMDLTDDTLLADVALEVGQAGPVAMDGCGANVTLQLPGHVQHGGMQMVPVQTGCMAGAQQELGLMREPAMGAFNQYACFTLGPAGL